MIQNHQPVPGDEIFAAIQRHTSPGLAFGYKMMGADAYEVEATGVTVRLSDGRELLDFGAYAVTLLGHLPQPVVAATMRQLGLMAASTRALANPVTAKFVADLTARCAPLDRVWLGSDGADAVEAAIKLARRATGRSRVLAVEDAFHGKTMGALALTAHPGFRAGLEPLLDHVTHVPRDEPDAVAEAVARGDVAALVLEPIQGEGGVRGLEPAVVEAWIGAARGAGAFVIADEIQVGLGRCGPFSLALDAGWEPDAVLFGKALGGGVLPISALVATSELFAPLVADPTWHTSTFGGHPLACAAAQATLTMLDELATRGEVIAAALERGLRELATRHDDVIVEVRGRGLLWGLELRTPGAAGAAMLELARAGVLLTPCLGAPATLRVLPPLVANDAEIERALDAIDLALAASAEYVIDAA